LYLDDEVVVLLISLSAACFVKNKVEPPDSSEGISGNFPVSFQ
jgi:hypothetical protein